MVNSPRLLLAFACTLTLSSETASLKDVFQDAFLVGAALNPGQFTGRDERGAGLVRRHFNTITAENHMKWALIHPRLDEYDFANADAFVAFGEKNGMRIIGHTLVWHNQTPRWVFEAASRDTLIERMQTHIRTVVGRYKGRVKGWDVVNEAIAEDGSMRQSPWMKIIGEDYVVQAYQIAQQADPNAELYYNDYGLENPSKRRGAIELVTRLKAAGVRVAGVGLQGHYGLERPTVEQVDAAISEFAALGLKVHITELDVDVLPRAVRQPGAEVSLRAEADPKLNPYTAGLPDDLQKAFTERYAALFRVFMKHKHVIERVTFWGVTDRDSWLNNWPVRGRTNYPLLFDREGQPKPAIDAVVKLTR